MLASIQNEQSLIFINQAVKALFLKEPMAEGDQGTLGYYRQEIEACTQQITDAGTLKRIYLLARRLLGKQTQPAGEEAGRKAPEPVSWLDKARALLPQLSAEDQEVIYWRMDTMLTRRHKATTKTPQAEAVEDTKFTLKALVNLEMSDVIKHKTLDAILSYVRIVRQREGRA